MKKRKVLHAECGCRLVVKVVRQCLLWYIVTVGRYSYLLIVILHSRRGRDIRRARCTQCLKCRL